VAADAPVPEADGAGVVDLLARPLAGGTRHRRHDRTEETPLEILYLARTSAPAAPGRIRPRLASASLTARALLERLDGHLSPHPERRLLEREGDPREHVVAPPTPGPGPAGAGPPEARPEDGVEDVAEGEQVRDGLLAEGVVLTPFGRIGQDLVRGRHLLEPLPRLGVAVDVGMELT